MVIVISNLLIVTIASFFLGKAILALQERGHFWTRVPTDPFFDLALADWLFGLNAVHQGLIPVLCYRRGSRWVWSFFIVFTTSAVLATVALELSSVSSGLYFISSFIVERSTWPLCAFSKVVGVVTLSSKFSKASEPKLCCSC